MRELDFLAGRALAFRRVQARVGGIDGLDQAALGRGSRGMPRIGDPRAGTAAKQHAAAGSGQRAGSGLIAVRQIWLLDFR